MIWSIPTAARSSISSSWSREKRAASGLQHVAVEPERPLAERLEIRDRAHRAPDQPLDLDSPALLAAGARLASRPLSRRGRQETVLGGHPTPPGALQPARHALLDRRGAENPSSADRDQRRALRLLEVVDVQLERPQLVGTSSVGPRHAAAASSSAISTRSTPSRGSWRKRSPSRRKSSVSPVVRKR